MRGGRRWKGHVKRHAPRQSSREIREISSWRSCDFQFFRFPPGSFIKCVTYLLVISRFSDFSTKNRVVPSATNWLKTLPYHHTVFSKCRCRKITFDCSNISLRRPGVLRHIGRHMSQRKFDYIHVQPSDCRIKLFQQERSRFWATQDERLERLIISTLKFFASLEAFKSTLKHALLL